MKLCDVIDLKTATEAELQDVTLAAFSANSNLTEQLLHSMNQGEVLAVKGKTGRIRLVMKVRKGVVGVFIPRRYDEVLSTEHQINQFLRDIAKSRAVAKKVG